MAPAFRPKTIVLFVGDLFFFTFALWAALFVRSLEIPSQDLFTQHLLPFLLLFVVWIGVYFVAGLYESRSILLARRALSQTLLVAQSINVALAALFFFFVPAFGIAPKTILFIYLVLSFLAVLFWRAALYPRLGGQKREAALAVGKSAELGELERAFSAAHRAPVAVVAHLDPAQPDLERAIELASSQHDARFIIADLNNPAVAAALSRPYNYLARGVSFIDSLILYEEVFGRVPLSVIDNRWLARNISRYAHMLYDPVKRLMDVVIAVPAGILSLLVYPFVMSAIFIESGLPIFIVQKRVGQDGRIIDLHKFRSMERNDMMLSTKAPDNRITRVGNFIRKTRIDELPQLWDVTRGELSLIGPRPELPAGVELYEKEIPFYGVRHLIKPGLSGWAQLYHDNHPHHGADVAATREKLSFDLYYLKHRSLALDLIIVLKTIKKLLTRSGV
jgi:lipopolysaccharide/colanic/teichoic acid biosynthesis glycosyltransferase